MSLMTTQEQEAFLVIHIPYKLGAIDLCQEAVDLLIQSGDQHDHHHIWNCQDVPIQERSRSYECVG